ncbi:MAG: hypothetical protein ACRDXD_15085 [Acidimicrobiia bacterium]
MILELEMPYVDPTIHQASVVAWHKQEGEPLSYGDEICTLAVHQLVRLKRDNVASRVARRVRRERASRSEYFVKGGDRFIVHVVVTASDEGFLRELVAREADLVAVGDRLALVSTDAGEPLGGGPSANFRVVGNLLEHSAEDSA